MTSFLVRIVIEKFLSKRSIFMAIEAEQTRHGLQLLLDYNYFEALHALWQLFFYFNLHCSAILFEDTFILKTSHITSMKISKVTRIKKCLIIHKYYYVLMAMADHERWTIFKRFRETKFSDNHTVSYSVLTLLFSLQTPILNV